MKNYLIIGASSGIGRALSKKLANEGHNIYATFNTNEVEDDGENENFYPLDVTADELDLSFVPDKLDGFVYCPGSINLMPFARISPADFMDDFNLQVNGAIKILKEVMKPLKKGKDPSIVFFSTVAVQTGFNYHTQVAVSKGAIEGLTRALAAELAPKIRVNAVAPSLTDTPLASRLLNSDEKKEANADRHPLKKIGKPENIAEMAAFLLSDKAEWITGQVMHVDGGMAGIKN